MRRFHIVFSTIAFLGTLSFIPPSLSHEEWMLVRSGKAYGISGIAWIDRYQEAMKFLIVHDNKTDYPERLAIVSIPPQGQPEYCPLKWSQQTELPTDLEGLVAVPGNNSPPRFMASTSTGRVYDFTLDTAHETIEIIQTFDLPEIPAGSNFEGFALAQIHGKRVVAWAHRGEGEDPAILYWGELNLEGGVISPAGRIEVRVPVPIGNPRHISDLKIDRAGRVWIGAATDPGDEGPFESAIYIAGRFKIEDETIAFQPEPTLTPLARYPGHKIEAIELLPESGGDRIFGTDDENFGGFLTLPAL
jgi:hypothetical protein